MKKILPLFLLLGLAFRSVAQQNPLPDAPYKKHPFFPPAKLLLPDSSSWFTKADLPKKKPVMLVLFNPKCEHCQHETRELVAQIDRYKGIQIVMATTAPFEDMKKFREEYGLSGLSNVTVGWDNSFFLPVYFDIHNLPFHAFYNKKGELISVFNGSMTVEKTLAELEK